MQICVHFVDISGEQFFVLLHAVCNTVHMQGMHK